MSFFENPDYIKLLQNLLQPKEDSSDSEDESGHQQTAQKLGPGHIGPERKNSENVSKIENPPSKLPTDDDKDEIDKWLEKQETEDSELLETRKMPEHKIIYKQAIGTEDVFFQMNNRTAASMSCEDIIIEVSMPDETVGVDEMNLKLTKNEIDLKSPIYHLKLPLTHEIDPDKGNAKFDTDTKILTITLRMKRELDFVNF